MKEVRSSSMLHAGPIFTVTRCCRRRCLASRYERSPSSLPRNCLFLASGHHRALKFYIGLTPEQYDEIKQQFGEFDADNSGTLTQKEVRVLACPFFGVRQGQGQSRLLRATRLAMLVPSVPLLAWLREDESADPGGKSRLHFSWPVAISASTSQMVDKFGDGTIVPYDGFKEFMVNLSLHLTLVAHPQMRAVSLVHPRSSNLATTTVPRRFWIRGPLSIEVHDQLSLPGHTAVSSSKRSCGVLLQATRLRKTSSPRICYPMRI